jgi:hypothetical protein
MATTKVTANVLADDSITQAKLADDAVGAAELASNAVVNASIASGAAIDMDKFDGDSLASAITDFAQDDLVILSDTSDSGNLVKITTSNFEDAIFGNISGDVTLAAGGAATAAAAQTNITSLLATDIKIGEDDQTKVDFETADTINFYAGNEKQLILTDGALTPGSNAIVDLGTDALEFKDAFFDGTVEADAITIGGVTLAETIADTVGTMVTSNTETGITVTYDDSDNTLDFVLGTITSLGTIGTGVWQGTAIASGYIANDAIDSQHYAAASIDNEHLADDAVDSAELAAGAVDLAHMSVNSVDSDQYVDGSIDNAHLADDAVGADELAANAVVTASIVDDNITFAKIENRYTELVALGSHGSAFAVNGLNGCTHTATMTGNCTFTLSNMAQGQVIDLVVNGNYTITLAQTGATFNKIGSTDYDGSTTNLIQIVCADDASSEIYYYSVAPYTSDTTP